MTEPNLPTMRRFVLKAQANYATGQGALHIQPDGRKQLIIEDETWWLGDEFDGGDPFCGIERLVDKTKNHVVWNGYYHGWLTIPARQKSVETIFNFLRLALQQPDEATLLRGPAGFAVGDLRYTNQLEYGKFGRFYGHETIHRSQTQLYYGRYGGGLVDLAIDTSEG